MALLLHEDWGDPCVVCAGGHQRANGVGKHFGGDVVGVGFENDQRLDVVGCVVGVADDHLHHVGAVGGVLRSRAVADGGDGHRGRRTERCCEGGDDGDTGRGRNFVVDVDAADRNIARGEHGRHCRSGTGDLPVRRSNRAVRSRKGRRHDGVDAEHVECRTGAHHVDDCVEAADLVEFDVVNDHPVDFRFGFTECAEHRERPRLHAIGYIGRVDERDDVAVRAVGDVIMMVVIVMVMFDDDGMRRGDAAAIDPVGRQRPSIDIQTRHDVGDCGGVGTGVDERTEQHVPRDTRRAVEPRNVHAKSQAPIVLLDIHSDVAFRRLAVGVLEVQKNVVAATSGESDPAFRDRSDLSVLFCRRDDDLVRTRQGPQACCRDDVRAPNHLSGGSRNDTPYGNGWSRERNSC